MVRIRLKTIGTKNRKQYRIVVTDIKSPRDGRFIEEIGSYDPLPLEEKFVVKEDRLKYWLEQGAQPSGVFKALLKRQKNKKTAAAA